MFARVRVRSVAMSTKTKSEKMAGKSQRRRPAVSRPANSGEVEILRLVAEHRMVTVDQLARFLRVGADAAGRRVRGLVSVGWAEVGTFRGFDDEWVWLRVAGYRRSGTDFHSRPVLAGQLDHVHAIAEARLVLRDEFPQGVWVCERELWRRCRGEGAVPDGLLELSGRRVAVEVDMSRKRVGDVRAMMSMRCEAYDEVIYFATRPAQGPLEAVRSELGAGKVSVRPIAGARQSVTVRPLDKHCFDPEPDELEALRLLSEEGVVAADQLGVLLGQSEEAAAALAARLEGRNFIRREFEVAGDGGWLRCTKRANDLSGTGLWAFLPTGAVGLERRAMLARIRVDWLAGSGWRRWSTRRMLIKGLAGPRRSDVPAAVAESREGRFAVMFVDRAVRVLRRRRDLAAFSVAFDGVLCFAGSETMDWVRNHVAEEGFENVEILPLP